MLGAKDVAAYWSDRTFDGHPVIAIPVSSDRREGDFLKSSIEHESFINSSVKDIKEGKHAKALKLFKFMVNHADRR